MNTNSNIQIYPVGWMTDDDVTQTTLLVLRYYCALWTEPNFVLPE